MPLAGDTYSDRVCGAYQHGGNVERGYRLASISSPSLCITESSRRRC